MSVSKDSLSTCEGKFEVQGLNVWVKFYSFDDEIWTTRQYEILSRSILT